MEIPAFLSTLLTRQYAPADVRRILAGFDTPRRTTLLHKKLRSKANTIPPKAQRSSRHR